MGMGRDLRGGKSPAVAGGLGCSSWCAEGVPDGPPAKCVAGAEARAPEVAGESVSSKVLQAPSPARWEEDTFQGFHWGRSRGWVLWAT